MMRAVLGLVLLAWASCHFPDSCFDEFREGRTYRVTVVEPYVDGGTFAFDAAVAKAGWPSCGREFDFAAGDTFNLRAGGERLNRSCLIREAEPRELMKVTFGRIEQPTAATDGATAIVTARYEATVGSDCPGHLWGMQLDIYGGRPFAASVPGQLPAAVMVRKFSPTRPFAPGCKRPGATITDSNPTCRDAFVVKLEPVP
jgi:hypothetical protein